MKFQVQKLNSNFEKQILCWKGNSAAEHRKHNEKTLMVEGKFLFDLNLFHCRHGWSLSFFAASLRRLISPDT